MATVGQLMTKNLSTIQEEATVHEAARSMHQQRIGSLLVRRQNEYAGIITETDIVKGVAEERDMRQLIVQELMSSPIISIDQKLSPQYARDLMADRHIRHLVVTEEKSIVGIISARDLLAYFKTVTQHVE
ncbi:MAG: CBS domain-containing protein [Nitrospirales bacterium]|nr:CBS domain-containing protein [Nitrospira sp.]MDR4500007.1 CBS domain-containing protein [Nitrospirales bacterium]